jgi:hypothetical protein
MIARTATRWRRRRLPGVAFGPTVPSRGFPTAIDRDYETPSVATPLAFAPKANSSLLTLSLKDTTSILAPKWAHLSPCFGAALTTSPMIGNLLRIGPGVSQRNTVLSDTAILTNHLFFQMIRESPIFLTRTKSMPAAHLTPRLIGGIVGHSLAPQQNSSSCSRTQIQQYLKQEFGIQSNKINGNQWTGISLTRWMDLFHLSRQQQTSTTTTNMHWMPLAVWLVALWETSHSKLCWLDFYLECDKQVQATFHESIFRQDDDDESFIKALQEKDPTALDQWQSQSYCPNQDLSISNVQSALDQLIYYYDNDDDDNAHKSSNNMDSHQWRDVSRALEVVCASVALGQVPLHGPKPSVPNGYYGYDGGDLKAGTCNVYLNPIAFLYNTCVRSLSYYTILLYDYRLHHDVLYYVVDCVEATIREIMDLLLWDDDSGSFDLSRLPPTAAPELAAFYQKVSGQSTEDNGGFENDDDDKHHEIGKEWFDMLSGLPGCDYLATGPDNGKFYELAPTMESAAKVCHHLLVTGDSTSSQPMWTTLHDLSKAWNAQSLHVQSDTLLHRISSSKHTARHEIATLQLSSNPNCMELRMRCDWSKQSGFSAVTHLRQRRNHLEQAQIQKFRHCLLQNDSDSPIRRLLALSLSADDDDVGQVHEANGNDDEMELFQLDLLSTPFGCDRRGVIVHEQDSDIQHQQHLQEEFIHGEHHVNCSLLKAALYRICDLQDQDPESCRMLLIWMLQESPVVVESSLPSTAGTTFDRELELAILSLPTEILANEMVQQSLWNNNSGLLRGTLLAACAQFKSGKASLFDIIFGDLKPNEVISLVSLLYASSQQKQS